MTWKLGKAVNEKGMMSGKIRVEGERETGDNRRKSARGEKHERMLGW